MQYVLISTLFGSGGFEFCQTIGQHPYVRFINQNIDYNHISDWSGISFNYVTTLVDIIYFNHACNYRILPFVKFIYIVRDPGPVLKHLVHDKNYSTCGALRYYCYRLRRICEMAKHTSGLLLTTNDLLNNRFAEITKVYLGFKRPIPSNLPEIPYYTGEIDEYSLRFADQRYNAHLAYLNSLPLIRIDS